MTKKILLISLLNGFLCISTAHAAWRFAWQENPVTKELGCSMASDAERVWTGPGGAETTIELGVQTEGLITLRSDRVPFDIKSLDAIGINVDDRPAVAGLQAAEDGLMLSYPEEEAVTLHRLFESGSTMLVTVAFAKLKEPVTKRFSLEGYRAAAAQYKGCRGLLMNTGWVGLSMTTGAPDGKFLAWLAKSTPYRNPGIELVVVDPRKEAHRADLRPGDRIVGCNGQEAEIKTLIRQMKELEAGAALTLDIVRERTLFRKTLTRPKTEDAGEEQRGGSAFTLTRTSRNQQRKDKHESHK